jgi:hypothetical protein
MPAFDGNPRKLTAFCSNIRKILSIFGRERETYLFMYLQNKITGRAADNRIIAFEKNDRRSEDNRLTTINNTDHRFRDRNEAPPSYRNNNGRRLYPSNNTVQNNRNNGPRNVRNQGSW